MNYNYSAVNHSNHATSTQHKINTLTLIDRPNKMHSSVKFRKCYNPKQYADFRLRSLLQARSTAVNSWLHILQYVCHDRHSFSAVKENINVILILVNPNKHIMCTIGLGINFYSIYPVLDMGMKCGLAEWSNMKNQGNQRLNLLCVNRK